MKIRRARQVKAYANAEFLNSGGARSLRILAEYLEPQSRFEHYRIDDTIVFLGSSRLVDEQRAQALLGARLARNEEAGTQKRRLEMSRYYEAAKELANRFTLWSKQLGDEQRRFVVCTGGGPGIMEAANLGASEARGLNVGLTISLPDEGVGNRHITRELSVHFHYFFMRKFWLAYLAKAVLVFPGGFGTLDELFELLTLRQTRKIRKHLPMVLFGPDYWEKVIDWGVLVDHGMIDAADVELLYRTDSVDDAFDYVTRMLGEYGLAERGATL